MEQLHNKRRYPSAWGAVGNTERPGDGLCITYGNMFYKLLNSVLSWAIIGMLCARDTLEETTKPRDFVSVPNPDIYSYCVGCQLMLLPNGFIFAYRHEDSCLLPRPRITVQLRRPFCLLGVSTYFASLFWRRRRPTLTIYTYGSSVAVL